MIKITLAVGVFLYLLVPIVLFSILWIISANRESQKKTLEYKGDIWYCNICGFTYIDTLHAKLSKCPRCTSYIEVDNKDK